MLLSADEIDKLTLGEIRAIVERAADTLEKLRAVQSLFGAPAPVQAPAGFVAPAASLQPGVIISPITGQPLPQRPPSRLTPDQEAELAAFRLGGKRQQLLEQNRGPADEPPAPVLPIPRAAAIAPPMPDDFPADIAAAMKQPEQT